MQTKQMSPLPAYPFPFGPFGTSTLIYDEFRKVSPVRRILVPSGLEVWLVTRYDDIVFVHQDVRMSRDEAVRIGASLAEDSGMELVDGVLQNVDGERHISLRKVFAGHYDRTNVARWTTTIAEEANNALSKITPGKPFDLRADFFEPVGRRSAARLFGFPTPEGRRVLELFFDPVLVEDLKRRLIALIRGDEKLPLNSYISDLQSVSANGTLSEQELLVNLIVFYTVTFEATGGPFLGGMFAFLRDRSQWDICQTEPDIIPNAVEEMLRCYPNGDGQFLRVAMENIVLSGVEIRQGDVVLAPVSAANADPEIFPDPRRFDVRRPNSNRNIAFAIGRHHCMGWRVAKVFIETCLRALLERTPSLRLAVQPEAVTYRHMPLISIMETLPVIT